jgi:CBS domain-containing protein
VEFRIPKYFPSQNGRKPVPSPDTDFKVFLSKVTKNDPQVVSTKDFLALWGAKKRGSAILSNIENELESRGLVSVPEIATADYYGSVTIRHREDDREQSAEQVGWPISSVLDEDRQLISVMKQTPLDEVETLMVMRNFSQIPVLSPSGRELYGTITWKALAAFPRSHMVSTAEQAMIRAYHANYTARSSDSLLTHIATIISNEYIYIQSPSNEFVGILTATDLASSFLETAGPFIKLGEIEQRIRILIDRLPLSEIQAARLSLETTREVRGAADLTFGEYIRILQSPDNWERIGLPFDRVTVVKNLEEVGRIRNDVMHFRPHAAEGRMTHAIDWCLNWLREARTHKQYEERP